mgnify:CR=1 FL=1
MLSRLSFSRETFLNFDISEIVSGISMFWRCQKTETAVKKVSLIFFSFSRLCDCMNLSLFMLTGTFSCYEVVFYFYSFRKRFRFSIKINIKIFSLFFSYTYICFYLFVSFFYFFREAVYHCLRDKENEVFDGGEIGFWFDWHYVFSSSL